MIRASRKRVALLQRAQLTYVSVMAARRVPRTSSCMSDTCLSLCFSSFKQLTVIPEVACLRQTEGEIDNTQQALYYGLVLIDYGTPEAKLQVSLTCSLTMCYYIFSFI